MPTSFEALHNETRPLRLLDDPPAPRPAIALLASVLLVVLPLLAAVLL